MPDTILTFGVGRCNDRPLPLSNDYLLLFLVGGGAEEMRRYPDGDMTPLLGRARMNSN